MLFVGLILVHILVSLVLIAVVLLQTGKRADLAGAFGGGGSQTAFGTRGAATLLSKMTTICAVIFMLTSLGLSIYTSHHRQGAGSVLEEVQTPPAPGSSTPTPSTPAAPAPSNESPPESSSPAPQAPANPQPTGQ
jgi:preprotein translocase subunit SecG